jgi:transcriptional regulator with XRE-family HTH domain
MEKAKVSISTLIGEKIKHYRKEKKMTIENLAAAINKSVSTVSKYESGAISIDVETLFDIAIALDVDIGRLVDFPTKSSVTTLPGNPFGTTTLYLYQYDGRIRRIVRSLIQLYPDEQNDKICANFYLNVPSFEEYNKCQYFYKGPVYNYDTVIHFILSNPYNPSGRVAITTVNPYWLSHLDSPSLPFWGVLLGLSFNPFGPFASKVLLSKTPKPEDEYLKTQLQLTKEDLRKIKLYNLLILNL